MRGEDKKDRELKMKREKSETEEDRRLLKSEKERAVERNSEKFRRADILERGI